MLTQKAVLIVEVGEPAVAVVEHPLPDPGEHQIQLKVAVAGLNPHDQKARDYGLFIKDALPAVLANDIVGVITKLGAGVTDFAVGDRVVSQGALSSTWHQQGLQEYAIEDAAYSCRIPKGMSDDDAATLPTNLIAGVVALFSALDITPPWFDDFETTKYKSDSILIIGGGSNCGKFGVQLAKLAGFGTIVVVGGSEDELRQLGATHVIDRHNREDHIVDQIRSIVGDELIYAYDTVNPPQGQLLAIKALSNTKRGRLARLLSRLPQASFIDKSQVMQKEAGFEVKDVLGVSALHPDLCRKFWRALPGYLESGAIRPTSWTSVEGLTAANVNAILDGYRDGRKMAKTHIHF